MPILWNLFKRLAGQTGEPDTSLGALRAAPARMPAAVSATQGAILQPRPALATAGGPSLEPPPSAPPLTDYKPEELPLPDAGPALRPRFVDERPNYGVIGYDTDPRSSGLGERPRIAKPLEYATRRLEESELAPPPANRNSKGRSILEGAGRGFRDRGVLGAIFGAAGHALDSSQDEKIEHAEMVGRDREQVGSLAKLRDSDLDLEGKAALNRQRNNLADYTAIRPELERTKIDNKQAYDAWRMTSGDRKQDSAERYIEWRMANGDRRAATAEGQLELRREWDEFRRTDSDRSFDLRSRMADDIKAHRDESREIARQRLEVSRQVAARGGNKEEQKGAADDAEADYLEEYADSYDKAAEAAEEVSRNLGVPLEGKQETEVKALRKKAQTMRERATIKRVKTTAVRQSRPPVVSPSKSRQGADPLGIFR